MLFLWVYFWLCTIPTIFAQNGMSTHLVTRTNKRKPDHGEASSSKRPKLELGSSAGPSTSQPANRLSPGVSASRSPEQSSMKSPSPPGSSSQRHSGSIGASSPGPPARSPTSSHTTSGRSSVNSDPGTPAVSVSRTISEMSSKSSRDYPSSGRTDSFPSTGRGFTTSGTPSSHGPARGSEDSYDAAYNNVEVSGPAVVRTRRRNHGSRQYQNISRNPEGRPINSPSHVPDHMDESWDARLTQTAVKTLSQKGRAAVQGNGWRSRVTVDATKSKLGGYIGHSNDHDATDEDTPLVSKHNVRPGTKKTKTFVDEHTSRSRGVVYGKGNVKISTENFEPGYISPNRSS